MKKRLLSLALTLCMVLALLPVTALAEDAITVMVGNTEVVNGDAITYWMNDGEGGITSEGASASTYNVKYDPTQSTPTLTLKGAVLTKNHQWEGVLATPGTPNRSAAIYTNKSLIIELADGTMNHLTGQPISGESAGAYISETLTISGTGALYATGESFGLYGTVAVIEGGVIDAEGGSHGFYSSSKFPINGGTLTAAGTTGAVNSGGSTIQSIYDTACYASTAKDGSTSVTFENTREKIATYKYLRIGSASDTVAAPTISPVGGTYGSAQSVTLTCDTPLSTIYYTTNGEAPTSASTKYVGAFSVPATATVKAIAVKGGMTSSTVVSAAYTINTVPVVTTADVSNFAELKAALADSNVETITLTDDIIAEEALTIDRDVTIAGGGKTLSATVTGVDAQGVVQTGSEYTIFTVDSGKTVTMKNLTVMGGSKTAIKNSGTLKLANVTITRSGSASVAGGGISNGSGLSNGSGTLILKNCSVIRNVANNGGGMLNSGGTVVLDGCSLSENRSIGQGGGAIENKSSGKMYINNSVIANNTSSEIGGGINNYNSGSTLYLMNTTVTGNATTRGAGHGGGIGNNGGPLYAVNSIITDNYYADTAATTTAPSDIGYGGENHLYYSVYGTLSDATLTTDTGNKTGDDNTADLFAAYVNAGVLSEEGKVSTKPYAHPQLLQKDSLLYAPLMENSAATTGGAFATYFDYSTPSSVKMSYKATDASDETAFGGLATGGTAVATYIEGDDRAASVIGASAASATKYFTVTLFQGEGGKATGGTNHGDAYAENAPVTLTATPNAGYRFVGWSDGSAIVSSASSYTFAVTKTVALTPVFAVVDTSDDDSEPTYAILDNTAADANGSLTRSKTYAEAGDIVKLTPKANSGYALDTLTVKDSKGNVIETTQNADGTYSFRMPRGKAIVAATFKAVEAEWVNPFEDVAESDWFFDEVKFTAINGIFAGTQPNRFSPNAPMTRAMFWTVMGRLDGQTLSGSGVYDAAREWAMTKGITDGTNPGDSITREQLITILWRYTGSPMLMDYPGLAQFEDAGSISSYARQAMAWAHQQGLLEGADGKLIPQSNATRAQVAAILTRYCQNAK